MSTASSSKLELILLGIFKWVVVTAMVLLMVSVIGLAGTGLVQLSKSPATPEPPKAAGKPTISATDFLQTVKPQPQEKAAPNGNTAPPPVAPQALAVDTAEEAFRAQSERLWVHVNKYQGDCGVASPLSKADFLESLRQTPLKGILELRGPEYAASQDAFIKETLGSPETVALCKSGRGGLLMASLEFHRSNWDRQVKEARQLQSMEQDRIAAFNENEANRVAAAKANAYQLLLAAAIAFGLFMGVALILIFSRLESNLRGVQAIVRGTEA